MDLRKQLGRNVRRFREQRGWSQEELAFEANLHRTYVSGVERGVRNPTVLILARIAAAMGIEAAELLQKNVR
jgi:transcriptional regulator with XRE-family HTH domain